MSDFFLFFPMRFYFLVTTVPCLIAMFCPLPERVRGDRTCLDDATQLSMIPDSRPVIVMAPKMCLCLWFPKGPHIYVLSCFSLVWHFATLWTRALWHLCPWDSPGKNIFKWVAMPSSRGSSQSRNWTCVSCVSSIAGGFFIAEPLGNPPKAWQGSKLPVQPHLTLQGNQRPRAVLCKEMGPVFMEASTCYLPSSKHCRNYSW